MPIAINFKICDNAKECSGIEVCPTGALSWDDEKNILKIDNSKCITCGKCITSCPVHAILLAKDSEELTRIEKEIREDSRKISDLFVDRYGSTPIDPDTLIDAKDFKSISQLHKPVLIEFFEDDSIQCLRNSIPIKEIIGGRDILFRKIKINEELLKELEIKELPSLVLFNKGNLVGKVEGYYNKEQKPELKDKFNKLANSCEMELNEVWKKLEPYFKVKNLLEIGAGLQDCPRVILDNAEKIERITIDEEFLDVCKKKYSYPNVNYRLMNAKNLDYPNDYFDTIFISSSYHEFDQSLRGQVLEEMYRVLKKDGYLILIEPRESSVTNDLFKVFDSKENHAKRIRDSFDKLGKFIESKSMKVLAKGNTKIIEKFASKKKFEEEMLEWWSDIKVPANETEKRKMIKKINKILTDAKMLDKLEISEDSQFMVVNK